MPEYLSPGVYMEEVSMGPRPIAGVSTSTAGFVGQTERGPEYPLLVTSWTEFQRWYGSYLSTDVSYLPHAVQGFFDNGGQRLFIARVVPGVGGTTGTSLPKRAQATIGDLTLMTVGRGDWGNRVYVAIEEASKARTAAADSPVKKWIKLTLLYYSRIPPKRANQGFSTVQAAGDQGGDAVAAAAHAEALAKEAKTAIAAFEAAPANAANRAALETAAKEAATKAKEAADAVVSAAQALMDAAQAALAEAKIASDLAPGDANRKAVAEALPAAVDKATKAKDSALTAAKEAADCADAKPPTTTLIDKAITSSTKAKDDITSANTAVTSAVTKAGAAYPTQAAVTAAEAAVTKLDEAGEAADDAKTAIAAFEAAPANAANKTELETAAKEAATKAKEAADAAVTATAAVLEHAKAAKTAADVGDQQVAKDKAKLAVDAATTAKGLADAVATAANACAIATPPTTTLNNATITAFEAAKTPMASVVTAVRDTDVAFTGNQPPVLAVNPMIQENQLSPNFRNPDLVEVYDNLRILAGASNSLAVTVNGASQLVVLELKGPNIPLSATEPAPGGGGTQAIFAALAGGAGSVDDNGKPVSLPTIADFKGTGDPVDNNATLFGTGSGLAGLAAMEGISLLAAPDEVLVGGLSQEVINQCELLRDRFGIVSSLNGKPNVTQVNPIQDTTYAAFYYPWIWVFDPASNGPLLIPPTGHITGLIARVDIDRGVHKAPANEVLRDAIDLEFPIPKAKQDILNPKGVNCVRDFRPQGRSIRVWGARTMTSDPEWTYINVRRLFIFVEQSILRGTNWVVFEPNDQLLWAKVRLSISAFLIAVWKSGALMGTTQEEAFFVRCDRTTMTQNDIDNGRLICLIGIAPVKPAEFVIFRISQKMQEVAE